MNHVRVIDAPDLTDRRLAFVLAEDRVGHYPEFADFLSKTFELERIGLSAPGCLRAPSGLSYVLVFIGRSGERFPAGVEIYAVVPAIEPLDNALLDRDLWAILRWLVDGVGGEWSAEQLYATGRLYKLVVAEQGKHPPNKS